MANISCIFPPASCPRKSLSTSDGKIQGLFFHPPRPKTSDLEEAALVFASLPGQTAILVLSSEGILAAHNGETPLAVASAFKLAVLAALQDQIDAGRLAWDDVVLLPQAAKSLPTGILQTWPAGAPVTVHTLAALMISMSDNTATDALIDLLGRETVESYSPRNAPFLTTREAFLLKDPANEELLARYRLADTNERRALLTEASKFPCLRPASSPIERPRPSISSGSSTPMNSALSWRTYRIFRSWGSTRG